MVITLSGYKKLLLERRGKLLLIKFNRPAKKNALTRSVYRELTRVLLSVAYDDSITIVALTGVGDCYTAGKDLTETQGLTDVAEFHKSINSVLISLVRAILHCSKLLVALVNGTCLGIGLTLSALFDVVYCTENAYFRAPFTELGICPEACSSLLLPQILGRSKASEMLLFGTALNAEQAFQRGLVAEVLHLSELEAKFWPRLVQYAELPSESLRVTKRLLRTPEREGLLQALVAECEELKRLRGSEAHSSAIQRFIRRNNKSKL